MKKGGNVLVSMSEDSRFICARPRYPRITAGEPVLVPTVGLLRGGNTDDREIVAIGKSTFPNVGYALGNKHVKKISALCEGIVTNRAKPLGKIDSRKEFAVQKRTRCNLGYKMRNGNGTAQGNVARILDRDDPSTVCGTFVLIGSHKVVERLL